MNDRERYLDKGYIALDRLLDADEVRTLQNECELLWRSADRSESNLRAVARATLEGGRTIDRLDPVSDLSPQIARLARGTRMRGVAAAALGEPALLMKDKLIYKAGGVQGYAVHQDFHVWQEMPVPPEAILSIGLAIDPARADNGAVQFYPGLHDRLHTASGVPTDLFGPSSGVVPPGALRGVQPEFDSAGAWRRRRVRLAGAARERAQPHADPTAHVVPDVQRRALRGSLPNVLREVSCLSKGGSGGCGRYRHLLQMTVRIDHPISVQLKNYRSTLGHDRSCHGYVTLGEFRRWGGLEAGRKNCLPDETRSVVFRSVPKAIRGIIRT